LILDEKAQPDPYIRHRIIRRTFDFRENLKIFSTPFSPKNTVSISQLW